MRRKDKQMHERSEIESVVKRAPVCRIALSRNDVPYIVPVHFGYEDNCLYVHSAADGHKIDILKNNNRVCFELETDVEVVAAETPCKWTTKYRSVIGHGHAFFVQDAQAKRHALDIITAHYGAAGYDYPPGTIDKLAVIRIEIDSMTGKKSGC